MKTHAQKRATGDANLLARALALCQSGYSGERLRDWLAAVVDKRLRGLVGDALVDQPGWILGRRQEVVFELDALRQICKRASVLELDDELIIRLSNCDAAQRVMNEEIKRARIGQPAGAAARREKTDAQVLTTWRALELQGRARHGRQKSIAALTGLPPSTISDAIRRLRAKKIV